MFLTAGTLALSLCALSQLPAISGSDLGVLEPFVEKATGIATWTAQLEQVVVDLENTGFAFATLALLAALCLLQVFASAVFLRQANSESQAAAGRGKKTRRDQTTSRVSIDKRVNTPAELWKETDPSGL